MEEFWNKVQYLPFLNVSYIRNDLGKKTREIRKVDSITKN